MKKITVTKPYLPPVEKYKEYVDQIWHNHQLTNGGPFLLNFEERIRGFLGTPYFHFVTNGTVALQLALRALDITEGEVITTPFSYVATTTSIMWERCEPVFVDIDPKTFCIDPQKIEAAITPQTRAILAVHVFGFPCDVDAIENIAKKHHLKVIYDGAHAFGCVYKGKSLLNFGDISTGSFHATKVFHTIEGGCVVSQNPDIHQRLALLRSFGHIYDEYFEVGINAKASEFQAVMGLCNLDDFSEIVEKRKVLSELYTSLLPLNKIQRPCFPDDFEYNYGYYAVVFETTEICQRVMERLMVENITPRRYFFPSLNTLPYLKNLQSCPVSESIASRVLSLPLYVSLDFDDVRKIVKIVSEVVGNG
jgi:dTDP-4-amino-4,6-dideoxygalactose transaminase